MQSLHHHHPSFSIGNAGSPLFCLYGVSCRYNIRLRLGTFLWQVNTLFRFIMHWERTSSWCERPLPSRDVHLQQLELSWVNAKSQSDLYIHLVPKVSQKNISLCAQSTVHPTASSSPGKRFTVSCRLRRVQCLLPARISESWTPMTLWPVDWLPSLDNIW